MAKRFLDKLAGDAYDEDVLVELIPAKRKPRTKNRKSFLDTIEEALESNAFDDVIPENPSWKRRKGKEVIHVESRFSTMITTEVLERARVIAEKKGIRIKDVINIALKKYIEHEKI